MSSSPEITALLIEWGEECGEGELLDRLIPMVLPELQRLARRRLRQERPGHTLQTNALINEAYLRLVDQKRVRWENRGHFFSICSRMMRRILVDHARRYAAGKRGGGVPDVTLHESGAGGAAEQIVDVVELDAALERLAKLDARQARIVELRYFGGLTIDETAQVIDLSSSTVKREWKTAKLWLRRELSGKAGG